MGPRFINNIPITLIFFFCAVRYLFRCRKDGPYAAHLRQIHLIHHFLVHHIHRIHYIFVRHVLHIHHIHHDHVQRQDGPSAALLHHVLGQASRVRGCECQGGRMLGRFLHIGSFCISLGFFISIGFYFDRFFIW